MGYSLIHISSGGRGSHLYDPLLSRACLLQKTRSQSIIFHCSIPLFVRLPQLSPTTTLCVVWSILHRLWCMWPLPNLSSLLFPNILWESCEYNGTNKLAIIQIIQRKTRIIVRIQLHWICQELWKPTNFKKIVRLLNAEHHLAQQSETRGGAWI